MFSPNLYHNGDDADDDHIGGDGGDGDDGGDGNDGGDGDGDHCSLLIFITIIGDNGASHICCRYYFPSVSCVVSFDFTQFSDLPQIDMI